MKQRRRLLGFAWLAAVFLIAVGAWGEGAGESAAAGLGVDHRVFGALLRRHVHGKGVDYAGLLRELPALQAYLSQLANTDLETATRREKLALYINAYNAFTLRLIARHYPDIDSIRDIANPWGSEEWVIAGETLSLDQIEHGILRGQFKDPRSHFAISRASVSSPPLQSFAYLPARINKQLDRVTRGFVQSDGASFSRSKGLLRRKKYRLRLSRVFKWFRKDFKPDVAEFVARHSDPETAKAIRRNRKKLALAYEDYDWGLNDYIK